MAIKKTEITRSFSYKLGQPNYSSVDFFCSITEECRVEDAAMKSEYLYQFCKSEVQKSLTEFLEGVEAKKKASEEDDREKVVGRANKKSKKAEDKENAKASAELDAGQETAEDLTED